MSTTPNLGLTVDVNKNTTTVPDFVDITESNMGLIDTGVGDIKDLIPTQASSSNQLADQAFVNSSINNVAAYYITRNAQGDPFRTKAELTNTSIYYSGGATRTPTRNDYCIVQYDESQGDVVTGYDAFSTTTQYVGYYVIYNYESVLVDATNKDSVGITPGTTICYTSIPTTRYTYNNGWEFQYSLNNTSFTAAQIAALNSGITSALVGTISANDTTLTNHVADTNNPHSVTASQVGLGNVDNTSDLNKPVSTATQTALDAKTNLTNIASAYSASSTYAVGDLVIYNGTLYECSTAIGTAEAWNSSHWTATTVDSAKQDILVSGTNIKTVNNQSLLGSGNIEIQGGGGGTVQSVSVDSTEYTPDANGDIALPVEDSESIGVEEASEIEVVTSISGSSTNSQIPTAKAVNDAISAGGVTLDTAQTITGAKTFDNDVAMAAGRDLKLSGTSAIQFPTTGDVQQDVIYRNNSGNLVITSPSGDILTNTDISPTATNLLDLGASDAAWKDAYIAGQLKDGANSVSIADIIAKADKMTVNTTSATTVTLANNTSFRLGTISSLTINNPSSYTLDFECEVVFTGNSGSSPFPINYSNISPTWTGDDVNGSGVFVPEDGKTYNIIFFNNSRVVGTPDIQAIVRSDVQSSGGSSGGGSSQRFIKIKDVYEINSGYFQVTGLTGVTEASSVMIIQQEYYNSVTNYLFNLQLLNGYGNVYVRTANGSTPTNGTKVKVSILIAV